MKTRRHRLPHRLPLSHANSFLWSIYLTLIFGFGVPLTQWAAQYEYQYDPAGRLISVSLPDTRTFLYRFDNFGNILGQVFGSSGDSDLDQLRDDWEYVHFGSLAQKADDDFDFDNVSNRRELLSGTDPANPFSVFEILELTRNSEGDTRLTIRTIPGRTYSIQSKVSLDDPVWLDLISLPAPGTILTWIDADAGPDTLFYRVIVNP